MTRAASSTEVDSVFMRRALDLARKGWGQTAPNPMVGAVVVAGGRVVGEGWHPRFGEPHAEVFALRSAGDAARGATMYVSLEPCAHFGKTPPCADAVISAGIARVVIAAPDPTPTAAGGALRLAAAGIQVDVGVERDAAVELNAPFFNAASGAAIPWVTVKFGVSADGAIADPTGTHRWITGPDSRGEVHRMRANTDAIAVGIGTVLADDPSLTVRDVSLPRRAPRRVVFDSQLRIPLNSQLVVTANAVETIVIGGPDAPDECAGMLTRAGVVVLLAPTSQAALEMLFERGIRSLLVEGGAGLGGALLRDGLVHRVVIFRSSLLLGETALRAFAHAPAGFEQSLQSGGHRVVEEKRFGGDLMTVYALREVPCSRG